MEVPGVVLVSGRIGLLDLEVWVWAHGLVYYELFLCSLAFVNCIQVFRVVMGR